MDQKTNSVDENTTDVNAIDLSVTFKKSTNFKALHNKATPLLLTNIWDAASARLIEASGAKALATSSASLAWSLGYCDGYKLPKNELLSAIARIQRVINVPLSIDIENGYSDNVSEVVALARDLQQLGVAGINIEDGIKAPQLLVNKITAIKCALPELFINARTDVYLANLKRDECKFAESLSRLADYKAAGADGVFIPGLDDESCINRFQQELAIPVNVMATEPKVIESMLTLGVERISVGPSSFVNAYQTLLDFYCSISRNSKTPPKALSYEYLNQHLEVD